MCYILLSSNHRNHHHFKFPGRISFFPIVVSFKCEAVLGSFKWIASCVFVRTKTDFTPLLKRGGRQPYNFGFLYVTKIKF